MLLWCLNCLSEELLETPMISDNDETPTKKVLPPLLDCRGNNKQFTDVCGCTKEFRTEWFVEEANGVSLLREDNTHTYHEGVSLDCERQ